MKHPVPAVGAIILKDDKILLVKRGAEPGIGKWSIPGGSMEFGETMEEAVKREVKEETGLDVEVGTDAAECCWVPLSEIKNYDLTVSLEEMLKKHGLI